MQLSKTTSVCDHLSVAERSATLQRCDALKLFEAINNLYSVL
jgi:hypothetical protein